MGTILRSAALTALLLAATGTLAETETRFFTVSAGHSVTVEFDYAPASYAQLTGKDVASVTLAKGATHAVVTATATHGTSQIEFKAPSGANTIVTIEILDKVDEALPSFESRVKPLGLRCSKEGGKIVVSGTLHSPADWARFQRICNLSAFKGLVDSDVEFAVDAATIDKLRADLEAAGVPLAPKNARPEEGQVGMRYEGNVLSFSGTVYSAATAEALVQTLRNQSWLKVVNEPRNAATDTVAQALVNVAVDDSMLEADVAFLLVSRTEVQKAGSKAGFAVKGVWAGFWEFLTLDHVSRGSKPNFRIDASFASTLDLFAGETFVRDRKTGHFLFKANGAPVEGDDATLRIGGTLKFTPPASGEGEAPEPQDFEYGFKVVNRGCHRVSADAAEIVVKVDVDGEPMFEPDVNGSAIRQEKRSFPLAAVTCAFGKTVAMSGFGHTGETTQEPTGTPIFRHIPIMNWFVSQESQKKEELDLLMLVSVRKVGAEDEPMVENDKMKDISYDANRPNRERIAEEAERDGNFHGCWEPLNWLVW